MARPSLEVDPVRNTSVTSFGNSLRMTAAVRVFPCTTLTLRAGCFLTNSIPPPFNDSFCKHILILQCKIHGTTIPRSRVNSGRDKRDIIRFIYASKVSRTDGSIDRKRNHYMHG